MSDDISTTFGEMVPNGKLGESIAYLEDALRALPPTPYHALLGKDFLHHTADVSRYLIDFHQSASAEVLLAALYFEMNGFTINPDRWFFSGFGYKTAGDTEDLDWLADWDAETDQDFTLEGMESVQAAFANSLGDDDEPLPVQQARELADHLVTARYMELIAAAHEVAKQSYPNVRGLPVLATTHDWDIIHQSQ